VPDAKVLAAVVGSGVGGLRFEQPLDKMRKVKPATRVRMTQLYFNPHGH
jgi:hypothetical protein